MATNDSTQVNEPIVTDQSQSEEKDKHQNEKNSVSSPTTDTETKPTNESVPTEPVSTKEENKADENFHIEKESGKKLTEFQEKKAKYFFNVNLDIENKGYVTWEDVDFYLLFHATAAGKEGSNGGDLEARLNRATRALWDCIHEQVPSADADKNKLSLEQALDTWASLSDFVQKHDRLPTILEDWVKVGFELYSEDNPDTKTKTISLSAFDELFQKMNLGRPYAIMAFKILTQHGSISLDYDKIQSIVKLLLTSSDDDHESHFILPGFFKTITNGSNKSPTTEKVQDEENLSTTANETPKESEISSTTSTKEAKAPSPKPSENNESKLNSPTRSETPKTKEIEQINRNSPQPTLRRVRQDDDGIRQLLKFYNIDDGDVVEVNDGPAKRVVVVHPERPVSRQNQEVPNKMKPTFPSTSSAQRPPTGNQKPLINEQRIPTNRARPTRVPFGADIRAPPSVNQNSRGAPVASTSSEKTVPQNGQPQGKAKGKEERGDRQISEADEQRLVASIIQKLKPVIEKRVAEELRRLESGENKNASEDDDDVDPEGFIPFPFLFPGAVPLFAGPPPSSRPAESSNASAPKDSTERNQNQGRTMDIEGMPPGAAAFLPPPLLMAMMNDLARVAASEGPMPDFPLGPGGPVGVEGFMMFVNGEPMMPGGPRGFPSTF